MGAPVHVPLWHASDSVQALPSLQAVPFGLAGFEQRPVAGAHVPASWQESLAGHATEFDPVHTPFWHASDCVQAFPSLQAAPFAFVGFEQTPVAGAHVPASWQESLAGHAMGFDPVHTPLWQLSN
jgi:hypothetical protein